MKDYPLVEIEWMPKKARVSQVYNRGLEYAFVSKNWKQIHQLVYCKDFLQDAIFAFLNKKRVSIYSFIYDPTVHLPIYLQRTRLLVSDWRDKTFPNRIEACEEFLHQFEKLLNIRSKTVIMRVKSPPSQYKKAGAWIFDASKRWQQSPPMISLYSLLIRLGLSHVPGAGFFETLDGIVNGKISTNQTDDVGYLRQVRQTIDTLVRHSDQKIFGKEILPNYENTKIGVYDMHNNCGVGGFTKGLTRNHFPKWHENLQDILHPAPIPQITSYTF